MPPDADYVRKQIRKARREARLSQEQLASLVHSTQSSISGLERGRVDITVKDLCVIADSLGQPITYFFPNMASELSDQEQQLLHMLRQLPEDVRQANFMSVVGLFELQRQTQLIDRLPKRDRESAAMDAFAQYLLGQGIRASIDEAGFPVLDGGEVSAIMEAVDGEDQRLLAEAVYRLQKLQK